MKKTAFVTFAVSLLFVGAGCAQQQSSAIPAAKAPKNVPAFAQAVQPTPSAPTIPRCDDVLSIADVEKLTGISSLRLLSELQILVGGSECKYGTDKGDLVFLVGLNPVGYFDQMRSQHSGTISNVTGIGEAAYMFSGYNLVAKQGTTSVDVATFISQDRKKAYITTDQLKEAADFVLGKL